MIRLSFLTTQQSVRHLSGYTQEELDKVRFFDVEDHAKQFPFGIDEALAELQRDVLDLSQAREKWKAGR